MESNGPVEHFDIVIVGAGIAGGALACALADSRLNIAVVEAQPCNDSLPPLDDAINGFDARVSALTKASQDYLNKLKVWPAIAEQRISPYRYMHVWDADGTGSIDFDASEINQPCLGHIVENRLITAALLKRMQQYQNITLMSPAKVDAVEQRAGLQCLLLADQRELQTPLIVAADGAHSKIRQLAGFTTREWDYDHHAIVATVATSESHQQTAWQRFLPEGPLAFLPLQTTTGDCHLSSIVWSTVPDHAQNLMALSDRAFSQALADAFEYRLGQVEAVSQRFCFPLRQRHASDYIKPGIALVADAAHTIHPLAGQGINIGLLDVAALATELLRATERGLPPGDISVLQRYQRCRKGDNLSMMMAMEGFKRLFEQRSLPVRWARNTGMRWVDHCLPVKRKLMRSAMGL